MTTKMDETRLSHGYLAGDGPTPDGSTQFRAWKVPWLPGYTGVLTFKGLRPLWHEVGRASVVHVSLAREPIPLAAALMALLRRRRLVLQPHGMLTSHTSALHTAVDTFIRPIVWRANHLIALTAIERQQLQDWLKGRDVPISTLGNPLPEGLPAGHIRELPARRPARVVFIARLQRRKRVQDFLAAAALIPPETATFEIYGPDGGDLHLVQRAASSQHNVTYGGALSASEVDRVLDASDVFVLPSTSEPWGNVLLAAMALGIPVVITASAALATEISAAGAGIVVPDQSPESIAVAVAQLLNGRELYGHMSASALRLVQQLTSPDYQATSLARIYGINTDTN